MTETNHALHEHSKNSTLLLNSVRFLSNPFKNSFSRQEYISSVVGNLALWTGCQCVGIRILEPDGAIPYESYVGFTQEFWESENCLSVSEHQCACTRIVTGQPDTWDRPILTSDGSVFTNDLQGFAHKVPENYMHRYRGKCIGSGFSSLAVIPIHHHAKVIGLIHLADLRKNLLSTEDVVLLESLSSAIGEVVNKFNVNDALRQKEAAVKDLESQLQQGHKMEVVGTMAGGIAHDFNNLLTIISGNLEFIEHQHDIKDHLKENLEHIRIATERAKQLTKQILTFSRRNECELVPTIFSVAIDEALRLLCSTIPVTVEIIKAVDNGAIINADTTQLQQVLINLCTNSVYAMNEKGVLRISLEEVEFELGALHLSPHQKAGRYAMLSVSDTGCGMEQKTVSKIFDPFFTTKDVGDGSGMGLSVVHGIVEHHDGFISVESKPGEGSTFNIYFPVITGTVTEQRTGIVTSLPTALPTGTEDILFVDDEEGVASICKKLLEGQGYQVTSLTSSFKALDIFKANPEGFDLVFTDQSMPEMSGTELAVELLKIRPDIPIILCSGYCAKVPKAEYKAMGVREFCMKPMGVEQLATVARRVLDKGGRLT